MNEPVVWYNEWIAGTIELYKGKLEMVIHNPNQISQVLWFNFSVTTSSMVALIYFQNSLGVIGNSIVVLLYIFSFMFTIKIPKQKKIRANMIKATSSYFDGISKLW